MMGLSCPTEKNQQLSPADILFLIQMFVKLRDWNMEKRRPETHH